MVVLFDVYIILNFNLTTMKETLNLDYLKGFTYLKLSQSNPNKIPLKVFLIWCCVTVKYSRNTSRKGNNNKFYQKIYLLICQMQNQHIWVWDEGFNVIVRLDEDVPTSFTGNHIFADVRDTYKPNPSCLITGSGNNAESDYTTQVQSEKNW